MWLCFPVRKVALLALDFTIARTGNPLTLLRIDVRPYQGMPTVFSAPYKLNLVQNAPFETLAEPAMFRICLW